MPPGVPPRTSWCAGWRPGQDEWQAVAGSTEPADRPRAEAAIRSLYLAAGAAEPAFAWVPSPAAGLLAYAYASTTRAKVVSPWARGDIGNGDNREFNGLARPFGMEPAWVLRLAAGLGGPDPARPATANAAANPVAAAAAALRMGGADRTMALVRSVASRAPVDRRAGDADDRRPTVDDATLAVAAAALGDAWPPLLQAMGPDLAGSLFADAVGRVVAQVLGRRERVATPLQAMQPGQWDTVTPVLASVRDVFGGYLWRPHGGSCRARGADRRPPRARPLGRAVVGAGRPRDHLGAPAPPAAG